MSRGPLIRVLLDRLERDPRYEHILGDVEEEYRRLAADHPLRGALWRWYQLLGLSLSRRPGSRGAVRPSPASRRGLSLDTCWQDLRLGCRVLHRDRLVTVTVIATLSLGIGATTTMFSIAHSLLADLPVPDAEDVVAIGIRDIERGLVDQDVSASDFRSWRDAQTTMRDIAVTRRQAFQVSAATSQPLRYQGAAVSPWAFGLLGVQPVLGRDFVASDLESAEPAVIIGHRVWRDAFDLDSAVIGTSLRVDGTVRTIVGVMPEGLAFPKLEHLWIPVPVDEAAMRGDTAGFEVFGRLAAAATLEQARAEFTTLGRRVFRASMPAREGLSVEVQPFKYRFVGDDGPMLLYTMLALVSLVLLIACANVTNVLLARAAARHREVAVRAALGASRTRLVRQLLTETLVLSLLGGAAGVLWAVLAVRWFDVSVGYRIGVFWVSLSVDGTALAFAAGLTVLATMVAGLAPALRASRVNLAGAMKDTAAGVSSWRLGRITRVLVGGEIALSCVLLVASGLMIKGIIGLSSRDLRFDPSDVTTGRVHLGAFEYPDDAAVLRFYDRLDAEWAERGMDDLVLVSLVPGRHTGRWTFAVEGTPYDRHRDMPAAGLRRVTPDLFSAFDMATVSGRWLDVRDRADAGPVAVVNVEFADRYFPEGAVGGRIRLGGMESSKPWREIVGVVDDRGVTLEDSRAVPGIFVPLAQSPTRTVALVVRHDAPGGRAAAVAALRAAVSAVDRDLPLFAVASLERALRDEIAPQQAFARLFGGFGLAALLLAAVGLYGTMAFAVTNRAREIGLRRALGGSVSRVIGHTMRAAALQLAAGLTIGLLLAVLVAPALGEFTFGTDPRDGVVFAVVPAVLALTALVAAWVPSRRAARIEPMQVLRYE